MYWFKGELSFLCPSCKEISRETIITSSPDHNPPAVAQAIKGRILPICQLCKRVPQPSEVQIQLVLKDLSDEERASLDIRHEPDPSSRPM